MLKSLFGLVGDVAAIAFTPGRIAVDLARVVTKPLADTARAVSDDVHEAVSDTTDED